MEAILGNFDQWNEFDNIILPRSEFCKRSALEILVLCFRAELYIWMTYYIYKKKQIFILQIKTARIHIDALGERFIFLWKWRDFPRANIHRGVCLRYPIWMLNLSQRKGIKFPLSLSDVGEGIQATFPGSRGRHHVRYYYD